MAFEEVGSERKYLNIKLALVHSEFYSSIWYN